MSHNSPNIGILNPNQGAKDSSFLSFSVMKIPPVIAGINLVRIILSTFLNSLLMPGIGLI